MTDRQADGHCETVYMALCNTNSELNEVDNKRPIMKCENLLTLEIMADVFVFVKVFVIRVSETV